jgi:hypothetical protein
MTYQTHLTPFDACFMLGSCLVYYSTLKMKALCPSETSINFYRTTRRYVSERELFITSAGKSSVYFISFISFLYSHFGVFPVCFLGQ